MTSTVIDTLLGVTYVYVVFSLICTLLTEWHSRRSQARAMQLKEFLKHIFDDEDFSNELFDHPLIASLTINGKFPSYIDPRVFGLALLDLSVDSDLRTKKELSSNVDRLIISLTKGTRGSFQHAQERVERWFTEAMRRLSGQYTRYGHRIALCTAIMVTLAFNIDSVLLARYFLRHPSQMAAIASQPSSTALSPEQALDRLAPAFAKLDLPLGWPDTSLQEGTSRLWYWLGKAAGWFLSVCALSLGAPFWFDTLNTITRLRQTGLKPPS